MQYVHVIFLYIMVAVSVRKMFYHHGRPDIKAAFMREEVYKHFIMDDRVLSLFYKL